MSLGCACLSNAVPASAAPSKQVVARDSTEALEELGRTFTVGGRHVPPQVFRDLGDGDLADSAPILISIDVRSATGSNRYGDSIVSAGGWVIQTQKGSRTGGLDERTAYRFVGRASNGLLVAISSYSGGGSGIFYTLHILDAALGRGFDQDGKRYDRVVLTTLRGIALGDRWTGDVSIDGTTLFVTTTGFAGSGRGETIVTVEAERP